MTEDEKKEFVYLTLKDLYHEFNHLVNHLIILREFFQDLLNVQDGKEPMYETSSILKSNKFKQE